MTYRLSIAIVVGLLSACTTKLTHESVDDQSPRAHGFHYMLPKKTLSADIAYKLLECRDDEIRIAYVATITGRDEADPTARYRLAYSELTNGWKTTKFTAKLYSNGTLKSVGASIDDRTSGAVKGFLAAGLSITTGAAKARIEGAPSCNRVAADSLRKRRELIEELRGEGLQANARSAAIDALERIDSFLTVKQSVLFSPEQDELNRDIRPPKEKMAKWTDGRTYERLDVAPLCIEVQTSPVSPGPSTIHAGRGEGVAYREPVLAEVSVLKGACSVKEKTLLASEWMRFGQLGSLQTVLLENNVLQRNNLLLSFAPDGALEEMEYGDESRLERAASVMQDSAVQLDNFLSARRVLEESEKTKELRAEIDLLKAQADLIEAQKRLSALQSGDGE